MIASVERERKYISGVLSNPKTLETSPVKPSELWHPQHRVILGAVTGLYARSEEVSTLALREELERTGRLSEVSDDILFECTNELELAPARHTKPLRDMAYRRRVEALATKLTTANQKGDLAEIARIIGDLSDEGTKDDKRLFTAYELATIAWEELIAEKERPRVRLGIPALDNSVGAVPGGSMVIVGARPNVGKTSLMHTLCMTQANRGKRAGFISCEDPKDLFGARIIGSVSGVNPSKMRNAEMSGDDYKAVADSINEMRDLPYEFADGVGCDVDKVTSMMQELVSDRGCELICIDYLQRIRGDMSDGPRMMFTRIAEDIKRKAARLNVPVILASQLRRADKEFSEPEQSDLKETSALEEMAEVVVLMWRSSQDAQDIDCKVSKLKWAENGKRFQMTRNSKGQLVEREFRYMGEYQ